MVKTLKIRAVETGSARRGWHAPVVPLVEIGGWKMDRPQVAFFTLTEALLFILSRDGDSMWLRESTTVNVEGQKRPIDSQVVFHHSRGQVDVAIYMTNIEKDPRQRTVLKANATRSIPTDFTGDEGGSPLELTIDLDVDQEFQ